MTAANSSTETPPARVSTTSRVVVTRFQRSVDIPVNQCLLYAIYRLWLYASQVGPGLRPLQLQQINSDLNAAQQLLTGVQLDWTESFLQDGWVSGTQRLPLHRWYYRPALDLAHVIIGRDALLLDHLGSSVRLPTLLLNMAVTFEAYLRQVLSQASSRGELAAEVVDGETFPPTGGKGYLFERNQSVATSPDIVVRSDSGGERHHAVIVEVKYKPAGVAPDRPDLNQAITYGLAYKSPHVVLAQPRARDSIIGPGLYPLGTVAGMTVS